MRAKMTGGLGERKRTSALPSPAAAASAPPTDYPAFRALARQYEAVPLVRTWVADLTTPLGAFLQLRGRGRPAFLLESVQGGEQVSRYSFVGSGAATELRARGERVVEVGPNGESRLEVPFWRAARERLRARTAPGSEGLPPFLGGAVGYLGYGCARWFEPALGPETRGAPDMDDARLAFFPTVVVFDHAQQRVHLAHLVLMEGGESEAELHARYERGRLELAKVERELVTREAPAARPLPVGEHGAFRPGAAGEHPRRLRSVPDREAFIAAVERAQEYIRAGDAFQIVLSRRMETSLAVDPLQVYRALRTLDPSPYMFYLEWPDACVLGASPETLLRCEGKRLWYRPIAGTRPRGADAESDRALEEELRADPKEVAEHVMLVDLGRNDLGRVAVTGSVRVERLMTVERYAHVMHLVSSLTAELRPELDRFDALAACFPAGTVSGAPKVRAMQIIDELEPVPRGAYAGAVLYLDYADNLDACIAIRTIVAREGQAVLQAGAGIVADSVPAREYEETAAKAGALVHAVEMAESWGGGTAA